MSLVKVAVHRPVTVVMFTLAITLFGMVALNRLPVTLLPELSYPSLTVRTEYPGAAPAEIEQLINRPIEESLGTVRGIRTITSFARAGQSDILLEFAWGTNMDMAAIEVREKLDMVQVPLDIQKPILLRFDPNLEPILRFALSGDEDLQSLRRYADEELKRSFETIDGIAAVRTGGGLEDEIQVLIDEQRTAALNITPEFVVSRLREENVNRSGGRVQSGRLEFLVRTMNQFQSLSEIENIYITAVEGRPIQLKDIATVRLGHKDRTSISRVNGVEAIEFNLYREGGANTVAVAERVKNSLDLITEDMPENYNLELLSDQSLFIKNAISSVKENAIVGGILAMAVILLFLRQLKPTLIISLAIPISVVASFFLMYSANLSLNIMSLGGIALAVGLLVDNAIVVLENISRRREMGDGIEQAAIEGTSEVSSAVTASTLTTLAVFVPMVFISGIAGQLFFDQALTVTFALIASLLVAITLIPMLASRGAPQKLAGHPSRMERPAPRKGWRKIFTPFAWIRYTLWVLLPHLILWTLRKIGTAVKFVTRLVFSPVLGAFQFLLNKIQQAHRAALSGTLKAPSVFFVVFVAITGASFVLLPQLKAQLIPDMEQQEFYVEIELPRGTPIESTDQTLADIAMEISEDPRIEKSFSVAGIGSLMQISANQGGEYWGRLHVITEKSLTSNERLQVIDDVRETLRNHPDLNSTVDFPSLISIDMPLTVEIQGHDLERVRQVAVQLQDSLAADDNFQDVRAGIADGQPELTIRFDHARLAFAGLTAPEVAQVITQKMGGQVASKYSLDDRQIDIRVRLPDAHRQDPNEVENLIVNPGAERELPLSAVATVSLMTGPGEITRLNQERVAIVSMGVKDGNLRAAAATLEGMIAELTMPPGIDVRVGGQSDMLESSYKSLMFALALAIFLVYLVMASQFESFGHPLLIMFSVPLAASGSILGLWLTNTPLSVVVFIGLIMLAGIVVNNAIVLIDRINQLRTEGMEKTAAIKEASSQRLRPILMTTLTTVLGLFPLALGIGEGAELTQAMAITVISGLMFATVLTLFFIPIVYQLFDRKRFVQETAA
ncbi:MULTISPECIES: efflux RND transporter permease subunit [Gammaproteobacteria]|uniref:efflux RND transporter permease subunit n=1 Tax=Gammaproteobacteria TaxID=1236 RepID=UPI000DD01DC6|nr:MULTISPECIES: efflux RND transporter permease subunit [Gammaproteobacteria]RTE87370.1 efflux RND transporter permease subunit [Aliidiomarina sp. B3213]TCZ92844.1 efflux RND transporter permease subunit [Lysobacter sp. N42]